MTDLNKIVEELNFRRNVCFTAADKLNTYSGCIRLQSGNDVEVIIFFPPAFPLRIPVFFVKTEGLKFLHTDSTGKMCLFEESSMLLKQNDKLGILLECFDKACEILNVSEHSVEYQREIKREFDAYWASISKKSVFSCIDTEGIFYTMKNISFSGNRYVLTESEDDGKFVLGNYFNKNSQDELFSNECLVIRLRSNSPLPKIREVKWKDVRSYIITNVSGSNKRRFKKYCSAVIKKGNKWIILVLPSDGGDILFGYQIIISNKRYHRLDKCINAEVEQLYINRIDREYLLERASADISIRKKQILLLGCGSVGGFIADNLCAAGIGNLDLLDADFFMVENAHRHLLGIDVALKKSSKNKADVLKEKLEEKYLYTDIDSLGFKDRTVESFIADISRLERYDLIISALGEPTLNLEINRILYENHMNIPFVVCFNEPYGVGGHVIVSNITRKSCLRCLYTDVISSELVEYRGSFVESGQSFNKNISGCGGSFVPYSRLDSQQTAIDATRVILDVIKGKITDNIVISWVGEDCKLKVAGKKESKYYEGQRPGNTVRINLERNPNCPICGE